MLIESVRQLFEHYMPMRLENKPELAEKIGASYKFVVTGNEASIWIVNLNEPPGTVTEADDEADCVITVAGKDLIDIVVGTLNGQMAFMEGKLKVAGDMALAMKLGTLLA